MTDLVTVLVSAGVGAIAAYLGAIWQMTLATRRVIHERVHESREKHYPVAWRLTGAFPRRPRATSHTYKSLLAVTIELRDWYYTAGGMYLSGGSRRGYSDFQDTAARIIDSTQGRKVEPELHLEDRMLSSLGPEDYEAVRKAGSYFRTLLTRDLLSRSRSPGSKFKEGPA